MNRTPKFIPCFEYIPGLPADIQVSTWHVHMGAMIGISGLTCKPLGFAQNFYSKLLHITVSPKTTCQDQKAGIVLNSLPIILYTEMSRSWWWVLSDILKFTQLFHFYCILLVPATLHLLLYEQMAGANSVGKVIQKENHSCSPERDFPRGFPRWSPPSFQDSSQ